MAEITAAKVNELRARTGQGMMDCKKVLTEAEGDVNRAIDIFRKRGVKSSLQERAASEGRVVGVVADDGSGGTRVEATCNTAFPARGEPVTKLAANAARLLLHNP